MSEPQQQVDELMREGYAALEADDYDRALELAARLRELCHSSNFEIAARARWGKDDRDGAIRILEEGVTKAPSVGILWHWLGSYRSDQGLYEGALEAFRRESEIDNSGTSQNTYNMAIVYERMERFSDALELLERVEAPDEGEPPAAYFDELRARLLYELKRYEQSIYYATRASESEDDGRRSNSPDWHVVAAALGTRANAHLALGDVGSAQKDINEAIQSMLPLIRTLAVMRKIKNETSMKAFSYKLIVHGVMDAEKPAGFYVSISCVADDPAEATRYAYDAVPAEWRESLSVDEFHDFGPVDQPTLKGATTRTSFIFYDESAEANDVEAS